MTNPAPYTCKHSCERDEIMNEIAKLQYALRRCRGIFDESHTIPDYELGYLIEKADAVARLALSECKFRIEEDAP